MRAAANDAGARREVKARGRFRCRMTAARKFFGRQDACRPLRTPHADDHNNTYKYDTAMTATRMTPNQIKVRVTCSWVWSWVWVVIEFAPFLLGGDRRAETFPVLGDPYNVLDFRLIPW